MPADPMNHNWPVPQIDPQKCDGCNLCVEVCPNHVLVLHNKIAMVAYVQKCDYSGLCEQICPQKAIQRVFEILMIKNKGKD
jgi:formate hydrogenlyase subunit 6/NADH:ubiquinone oxidoreductase subunit I